MIVAEALQTMRYRLNDVDSLVYTNDELLSYLNLGINAVGVQMVAASNPLCVSEVDLPSRTATNLPDGFHTLLPGQPCLLRDGTLCPVPWWVDRTVRYYRVPMPVAIDDSVPFPEPYCSNALNVGVELAAMRAGYDVTQERRLHAAISGVIFPQPMFQAGDKNVKE